MSEEQKETAGDLEERSQHIDSGTQASASEKVEQLNEEEQKASEESIAETHDALISPDIQIKGCSIDIPRITAASMYLLSKMKSPLAGTDSPDGKVSIEMDEMLEALYVIINQNDPRILEKIGDPNAMQRAVYELTRTIPLEQVPIVCAALGQQMSLVHQAAEEEGLAGGDKGEASGSST